MHCKDKLFFKIVSAMQIVLKLVSFLKRKVCKHLNSNSKSKLSYDINVFICTLINLHTFEIFTINPICVINVN